MCTPCPGELLGGGEVREGNVIKKKFTKNHHSKTQCDCVEVKPHHHVIPGIQSRGTR